MRDPHVRFCERHGGVISRAYSTVADAGLEVGHKPRNYQNCRLVLVQWPMKLGQFL
jgi:hypothetical protein